MTEEITIVFEPDTPLMSYSDIPDDLISRKAAVKAIRQRIMPLGKGSPYNSGMWNSERIICKLPSVESELRWIPCSEKLPEEYGCYRVTIEDVDGGRYSDFRWFATEIGFEVHGDKVVAWEPAPEPYMGE